MNILPSSLSLRLAAASLLLLTACAGAQSPAAKPEAKPDLRLKASAAPPGSATTPELWQRVLAANSDLRCDDNSQCHSLGVGSKACGGPEHYLAWSSKNSDGAELKARVQQHAEARRADDKRLGMMSTCSVVSDPGARCNAGQCVINERPAFGPGGRPDAR
ncbi:hypothetical protein GTP45_26240 [Pseudoduganella sp. FT55W]|uniref:DUF4189 domain-containing protein n=1 Tax=Duganella rivi TaxID=2666083 RepID=A0A7X4GW94_9BURK|nr:hypothetical protein [Duganella rivi]MYM70279.1 hypothetical protein [Duganella rivi]